jgi:hypothetical protein
LLGCAERKIDAALQNASGSPEGEAVTADHQNLVTRGMAAMTGSVEVQMSSTRPNPKTEEQVQPVNIHLKDKLKKTF